MQEFPSYNIKLRNKNNFELHAIATINETLVYLNMSSPTSIKKIGSKKLISEQKSKKTEK